MWMNRLSIEISATEVHNMSVKLQIPVQRYLFWAFFIFGLLFYHTTIQAAQVTLAWDPNVSTPDGYKVFQRLDGQSYDYASPVCPKPGEDPTQTDCTIYDLADETLYHFVVKAYVGGSVSGDSNEVAHMTGPAAPTIYSITTEYGSGGSVFPESATVNAGQSQTFTFTVDAGYHIEDVLVDGVSVGSTTSYTFENVTASHTVQVLFSPVYHVVAASAQSSGAIAPSGQINVVHGGSQTFVVTPYSGCRIADLIVDDQSIGSHTSYTFENVTGPHTIQAVFAPVPHVITASAGPNGSITPSGEIETVNGANQSFTITPQPGYRIADVVVDGTSAGGMSSYTFSNIAADHTIAAVFVADTYTVDASAGQGGTIAPNGRLIVAGASDQVFSVAANEGYEIEELIVDGESVGSLDSYTFSTIDSDHTIMASFRAVNQAPIADAGPDQVVDEQVLVSLNGLNSKDADDGIVGFEWRQINGTSVQLSSMSDEIVTFTAPDVDVNGEALEFELTVIDSDGNQSTDNCIVNVTWVNEAPLAQAGLDQSVNEGTAVVLSAADSLDLDDGITGYAWRQVQGPDVVVNQPTTLSASFTAPDVGPQGASLVFELTVTDSGGLQDTDRCTVAVTWDNMEPLADAGPDLHANAGDTVILDGSRSMDPDGMNLTYQWRQTFGPPVTLSDPTSDQPQFTVSKTAIDETAELTFELTVTDNGGLSGLDTCHVTIDPYPTKSEDNVPPTLTIGNPKMDWAVVFSRRYKLSGSANDDQQLAKVEWSNDRGGSGEVNGTTQWWKRIRLHRGLNVITITAVDTAGNQTSKQVEIYRFHWGY
jgi:hypothetical protein